MWWDLKLTWDIIGNRFGDDFCYKVKGNGEFSILRHCHSVDEGWRRIVNLIENVADATENTRNEYYQFSQTKFE